MIYQLAHWDNAYRRLLQNIRAGNDEIQSSVLVLCAMDADALCAARILSYLLRADSISYQLRPCPSHASLVQILSSLKKKEEGFDTGEDEGEKAKLEVGCVVMLNIGGMINLNQFYAASEGEEPILPTSTLTFVMDCHRPWHLANIHSGENIVLFLEEPLEDDVPSDGDGLSGDESESDSESDSDESDDSDSEEEFREEEEEEEGELEDDTHPPHKKRKTSSDESSTSSSRNDNDEEDTLASKQQSDSEEKSHSNPQDDYNENNPQDTSDDNDNLSQSTPASSVHSIPIKNTTQTPPSTPPNQPPPTVKLSFRQLQKARRDRISSYYDSGSYHRAPVSWIAYSLCRQLRFGDLSDLLWLACVGVTDAFLHGRLDPLGYTEFVSDLRRHIQRLHPEDRVSRAMQAIQGADGVVVGVSENGRIVCQTEFRFMLLRHWSLLDAMVHSNFVGTKLKIWKEQGRFRLTEMLAKMGFPLSECKQPWAFMKPSLKRTLREAVLEHKEDFNLDEIDYTGFIRVTGYKSLISASDMSYAITALLESETYTTNTHTVPNNSDEQNSFSFEDPSIIQSFNVAYDALNAKSAGTTFKSEGSSLSNLVNGGDLSGNEGLGAGIRLAMQLQKSIISTAVGLVDKNAITRLKHFRYAYLYATGFSSSSQNGGASTREIRRKRVDNDSVQQEQSIFSRPLALCKLAHFLMDMHQDKWVNKNARPLILLAEKPKTNSFLIVGYHFAEYEGHIAKNLFRKHFQLTAKSMEGLCHIRLDTFEGNAVEVEAGGEHRFIEQLHYLMDIRQRIE